jgi:hypothetical protein
MGPAAEQAVPDLCQALTARGVATRVEIGAAQALGAIGPAAREAVPELCLRAVYASQSLRRAATEALGKIAPDDAVPELCLALLEKDEDSRIAAAEALHSIKGEDFLAKALEKIENRSLIDLVQRQTSVSPEDHIKALFATLPSDPGNRAAALSDILTAVQKQSAEVMQPTVIGLLKGAHKLDYEGKAEVCGRINRLLTDTHLAFLNPETNLPARLKPKRPSESSEFSYILLSDTRRASDGRQHILRVQLTTDADELQQRAPRGPRVVVDDLKLVSTDQELIPPPVPHPAPSRGR